jgi:hypothetical protein
MHRPGENFAHRPTGVSRPARKSRSRALIWRTSASHGEPCRAGAGGVCHSAARTTRYAPPSRSTRSIKARSLN